MDKEQFRRMILEIAETVYTPEERQSNAVFALFGSAAQYAQHFEAALSAFLMTYNRIANTSLTVHDFEAIEVALQKKTMGALLKEFQKYVTIQDPGVHGLLAKALEVRNFLMHHFFREREAKLGTEDGRVELFAELAHYGRVLALARDVTNGMRVALEKKLDPTQSRSEGGKALFTMAVQMPDE